MSAHPLRKLIWKTGFDIHRHHPEPNHMIWLKEMGIKSVIDVGANVGQFASEIRKDLPDAMIYSFEPLEGCYRALTEMMKNDKKIKMFNIALGDTNEEIVMQKNAYSPSSSILKMARTHKMIFPHTKETSEEKITVRRLDDLQELRPNILEKEILFKIDTQGYEDKVIYGSSEFLKHVKAMIVETSFVTLYEKQPLFANIFKILTERNFEYRGALAQRTDTKTGSNLFEDSIFIKKAGA